MSASPTGRDPQGSSEEVTIYPQKEPEFGNWMHGDTKCCSEEQVAEIRQNSLPWTCGWSSYMNKGLWPQRGQID